MPRGRGAGGGRRAIEGAMRVEAFQLRTAADDVVRLVYELDAASERELQPDKPPPTLESFVSYWQITPSYREVRALLAWDGETAVGYGLLSLDRSGDNDHLLETFVYVVPDRRREGIGDRLVEAALDVAEAEGRRLLLFYTGSTVPAGAAFVERLGAQAGLEERESELDLTKLDRTLVQRWLADGPGRAPEYELLTIEGDVPPELIEQYAALYGVTSTAPRGSLELGDTHRTPEQILESDRNLQESGRERILCICRQRETGDLAGFTELSYHPGEPEKIHQQWTAVDPGHRGQGLGKWLKAATLVRALERWPEAKRVVTGNAYTNDSMLAINDALGFTETIGWTVWQVSAADARARLSQR